MVDKLPSLMPHVQKIVCDGATEPPGSGQYNTLQANGTYLCRRCGWSLFRAHQQFAAGCGWPSFDEDLMKRVVCSPDLDGIRTEISCGRCTAHLGHIFLGEQFTPRSTRYCVNSLALDFVMNNEVMDTGEAVLAGGCFWGVEHALLQAKGVLKVESGYTGGTLSFPQYSDVCSGATGHYEAVRVVYDVEATDYNKILMHFFEIHNPYQYNGQGPDHGTQYRSGVFYYDQTQKDFALGLIKHLEKIQKGVATRLEPVSIFWPAEEYHQDYYRKHPSHAHCHIREKRF